MLQGLLECKCCGYALYGKPVSRKSKDGKVPYAYYRCIGTDAYRFGGTRICANKQVRTDKLEEAVWQDACELLRNPKLLRKEYEKRLATPTDSASQTSLKKQLATAQRSMTRLIDAFSDGVLERSEFDSRLKRARDRVTQLKQQLESLESESREQANLREALTCLDDFTASIGTHLEQADWTLRREILRTLIDRVMIEESQVRIVYRINSPFLRRRLAKTEKKNVCTFVGGAISPLLANIVLNKLDWQLEQAGYRFVRYADDFVVVCQNQQLAAAALTFVQSIMIDLGLSLSPEKTKITTYGKGYDFLGFRLSRLSRTMRTKSLEKFKNKVREITRRHYNLETSVIEKLNQVIRGTANYFATEFSTCVNLFQQVDKWIRMRIRCMKFKRKCPLDNHRLKKRVFIHRLELLEMLRFTQTTMRCS